MCPEKLTREVYSKVSRNGSRDVTRNVSRNVSRKVYSKVFRKVFREVSSKHLQQCVKERSQPWGHDCFLLKVKTKL